ncbi:DMT family transporter [Anaerotruncus sp.]|uniref:DMT family transporter n=1 Tax=Anaerotruncus TaxID=244127 RepID=UPI0021715A99|nr:MULTISPECIES: DMT family transporter [Anaerotruncus]MCI8491805.1 DMT family transporter [Anaerotruncus sp.]
MNDGAGPRALRGGPLANLLAVCAVFLWGTAFPAVKRGYALFLLAPDDMAGRMVFAGERFVLAGALTLVCAAVFTGRPPSLPRGRWGGVVVLALVQTTLQYLFFYAGMVHTTGTKGAIIDSSAAFIGVILAHFLCAGERMTARRAAGCVIGFLGVVLVNLGADGVGGFSWRGDGLMLLAAASFAFGGVISGRAARCLDPAAVTGWQLLGGGALLLAGGAAMGGRAVPPSGAAWLLLGYLAALSAVAFTIWTLLLKYNPVAKISIYNSLTPVFGALCSAVVLGERFFSIKNLAALALVCGGVYLVNCVPDGTGRGKTERV